MRNALRIVFIFTQRILLEFVSLVVVLGLSHPQLCSGLTHDSGISPGGAQKTVLSINPRLIEYKTIALTPVLHYPISLVPKVSFLKDEFITKWV